MSATDVFVAGLTSRLDNLGLDVTMDSGRNGWYSVVNRHRIAMFHVAGGTFVSGWCITPSGRCEVTSADELMGAIKAVLS